MIPVEAQACGCPVIAYRSGGSLETVQDGLSGIFFAEQNADHLICAIRKFETLLWSDDRVRHQVEMFSREAFKTRIRKILDERQNRQDQQDRTKRTAVALQTA